MRLDHLLSERKENGAVYAPKPAEFLFFPFFIFVETRSLPDNKAGDIAQLARASALQAEGQGFESPYLQTKQKLNSFCL